MWPRCAVSEPCGDFDVILLFVVVVVVFSRVARATLQNEPIVRGVYTVYTLSVLAYPEIGLVAQKCHNFLSQQERERPDPWLKLGGKVLTAAIVEGVNWVHKECAN